MVSAPSTTYKSSPWSSNCAAPEGQSCPSQQCPPMATEILGALCRGNLQCLSVRPHEVNAELLPDGMFCNLCIASNTRYVMQIPGIT